MKIFRKERETKTWILALGFILIVALFISILTLIGTEGRYLDKEANSNNEVEKSYLDDQETLSLLYEREAYLGNNLSTLSPEKEVLGGTFYLTNVYWDDKDIATIEYEDGHIALRARVVFANGLELESFEIIKE